MTQGADVPLERIYEALKVFKLGGNGGGGGGSSAGLWTLVSSGIPLSGEVSFNNADPILATELNISNTSYF